MSEVELEALKETARAMGISFHPTIGLEKLKERIAEADTADTEESDDDAGEAKAEAVAETPNQIRDRLLKLVRVRVTCMDPSMNEQSGVILSAGNKVIPTQRKYVAFNVPWHVPQILLNVMKRARTQVFVKKKVMGPNGMEERREGKLIPTYAIEILPDLTEAEIKDLAQRQAMANGTAETQ